MLRWLGIMFVAVLIAAAGVGVAVGMAGGDATETAGAVLEWEEPPLLITPDQLPDDRVVYGTVQNLSPARLRATTEDFTVKDAEGRTLDASVQFLSTYAHGLYGAFQQPDNLAIEKLSRLGYVVDLETGRSSPLTVSYRLDKGSELPATLYLRDSPALELPSEG